MGNRRTLTPRGFSHFDGGELGESYHRTGYFLLRGVFSLIHFDGKVSVALCSTGTTEHGFSFFTYGAGKRKLPIIRKSHHFL
jgi:hypothetical protein